MEITLIIENKEKTFVAPFVSGRMLRKTLEISKQIDFSDVSVEALDTLVDYVVELFGRQFSRDDFYDGVSVDSLLTKIMGYLTAVMQKTSGAMGGQQDPNAGRA
jgi:hypothetical protein